MQLPEIKIAPSHNLFLNVMGENIQFSPYTIEHEKAILTSLESDKISDMLNNYMMIMRDCISTPIDFMDLSMVDFLNFVINIRAKSTDEVMTLQRKECTGCKKAYEFHLDIEKSLVYDNEDKRKEVVEIAPNIAFEIVPTKFIFMHTLDGVKDELDLAMNKIAFSTSKIIFDQKIYDSLDPKEIIDKLLRNISKYQLGKLYNAVESLITIVLEVKSVCPFCKHEEVDRVTDFLKFTD